MRKTSHDGGDSTSITSGVENEIKKSAMKPKKSSLKRKAQNFSQESDDTVIEPLLQKDKEKAEPHSAKCFGRGKTDTLQTKENDNAKTTTTGFCGTTESLLSLKDSETNKTTSGVNAPLHNYMNTNVFNTRDNAKANVSTKSQILVEIDSSKQSSYTPNPLIFTTAKIHTDTKSKQMEPVQVTPVPILSTVEVSVSKGGNITTNEKKISNGSSVMAPVYTAMPLRKEERSNASSCSIAISPTTNKDVFGKASISSSTPKLPNISTAQSNSIKITLPSTTSDSSVVKSNAKDKQTEVKNIIKDQSLKQNTQLQSKASDFNNTRNNVTVKTITSSSGRVIDSSNTSAGTSQGHKAQKPKLDAGGNNPANISSYDCQQLRSNDKTQSSKNFTELSHTAKNINSLAGNKQLQRQKPTTEEISNTEPKTEHSEILSAKIPSLSNPKIINNISIKDDKLPKVSANNTESIITSSSICNIANAISKTTPISTTTKPIATGVDSSNTVSISANVINQPSTTNNQANCGKIPPISTSSINASTNVNKASTDPALTSSVTKSPVEDISKSTTIPKSIITAKHPETEKTSLATTPISKTTPTMNSGKSKSTSIATQKQTPTVTTTGTAISTQPPSNTSSKSVKAPSIASSVKVSLASSITSSVAKPSLSTPQTSISKLPITVSLGTSVKAPAITTLMPKTLPGTVGSTSSSVTSTPGSSSKQSTTETGIKSTKVISALGKPLSSSITASTTAIVKSPNNNSKAFGTLKQTTTSIPKTESETTLPKTSSGSSNTSAALTVKSPQSTTAGTTKTKDSVASAKKPMVKTTSITTKSPSASSADKSIIGSTTHVASEAASATKKSGEAVLTKNGSVTTSIKTSSVSTLSNTTPDVILSSTASTAAIKPVVTQVSANKSTGGAGSSATPALKSSESTKKAGSKSSENNKDGKVSKA